jgi:hypothetical protein
MLPIAAKDMHQIKPETNRQITGVTGLHVPMVANL